ERAGLLRLGVGLAVLDTLVVPLEQAVGVLEPDRALEVGKLDLRRLVLRQPFGADVELPDALLDGERLDLVHEAHAVEAVDREAEGLAQPHLLLRANVAADPLAAAAQLLPPDALGL